jgi:hypothetical protein
MRIAAALAACAVALAVAPAAAAHVGERAQPRIAASVSPEGGLERTIEVRLVDVDGGGPIDGATVTVTAEMTRPHTMRLAGWRLLADGGGRYSARVFFPMRADWDLAIRVTGDEVVEATARLSARIAPAASGGSASRPATATPEPLPTLLADDVTGRDVLNIALLWLHGLAAVGWIVGTVALVLALSLAPGGAGWRASVARGYRRWGAWAHWALVPVVVGTGVYQMLDVTPFPLAWSGDAVRGLRDVPYGALYESILFVKLGLFAGLLLTATQVLRRTLRPPAGRAAAAGRVRALAVALGPSGVVYLALVPLILVAAVALRYVHILSHVGEAIAGR